MGLKQLFYTIVKYWISFGLFCYFERIKVVGSSIVPQDKPVLFLSNHQSALIDVLLIATRSTRKPWFLTRADVFTNSMLRTIFDFLQMIPIYRIKDGKDALAKNAAIFDQCGRLLGNHEALMLFPEANHNLARRVRPLSKGFTRIIFDALEKNPNLDLQLVPVGQNYRNAIAFPDSTALYFGKAIPVQELLEDEPHESIRIIKDTVAACIKQLTTDIEDSENYEDIAKRLHELGADYLNPIETNKLIANQSLQNRVVKPSSLARIKKFLLYLNNLPLALLWRLVVKPRVPEPEFLPTYRFGFMMLGFPLGYLAVFISLTQTHEWKTACLCILGHAVFNLILVKLPSVTSSDRRR